MKLSMVIPVYNEEKTLREIFRRVMALTDMETCYKLFRAEVLKRIAPDLLLRKKLPMM